MCVCHHKTIRSVGWYLLMQVNIASRAAILIMGNIIQYIVDDYEPLTRPTKLQAHSVQDAFPFTRSLQTNPPLSTPVAKCWCFFFVSFHSKGGWEGEGSKWNTEVKEKLKKKKTIQHPAFFSLFFVVTNAVFFMHVKRRHGERRRMLRKQ